MTSTESGESKGASDKAGESKEDAKPKFSVVSTLLPEQVEDMQRLYHQEWLDKNWISDKSLQAVKSTLEKAVKVLVAVTVPAATSAPGDGKAAPSDRLVAFGFITGDLADPLLEDIIVDKDFRKMGLGALIVQNLLQHEKVKAAPRIDLYCRERVVAFYEKLGFVKVRDPINEKYLLRRVAKQESKS